MFKRIMLRLQDMKTLSKLISGAEEQANRGGELKPGAEHFVMSALNLEEGSARRVFQRAGVDAEQFKKAVNQQYSDALNSIGIPGDALNEAPEPIKSQGLLHNSEPSGQELIKSLYELKQKDKDQPLVGAHVIYVAAEMELGVVARALKLMGIDRGQLATLAHKECKPL